MKIGRENRPAWIQGRHLERLGVETGIKPQMMVQEALKMSEKIITASKDAAASFVENFGESGIAKKIVLMIDKNSSRIQRVLS
jgi:ABC-type transport system involved in cytochrome c biogenesis ATPase subunit